MYHLLSGYDIYNVMAFTWEVPLHPVMCVVCGGITLSKPVIYMALTYQHVHIWW